MSAIRFGRKALAGESAANVRPGEVFVRAHTKTVRGQSFLVPAHFKRKARRSRRRSGSRKSCRAHQRRSRKTGRCKNFRKKGGRSRRRQGRRSKCKVKAFSLSGKSWCPPGTPVKRGRCCVKHGKGKTGVAWPAEVTAAYQAKQRWEDAKWRASKKSRGAKKNWAKVRNRTAAVSRLRRAGVRGSKKSRGAKKNWTNPATFAAPRKKNWTNTATIAAPRKPRPGGRDAMRELSLEILGVGKRATPRQIKDAYTKKLLETHPDKGGNVEDFMRVQNAWNELKGSSRMNDFGFGSGNGNPRYPNLTSVMGNYNPAAQMDLYQQYTGMSAAQFAAHMSGVLPSDVSNFYSK
jgi:hypothetical protein